MRWYSSTRCPIAAHPAHSTSSRPTTKPLAHGGLEAHSMDPGCRVRHADRTGRDAAADHRRRLRSGEHRRGHGSVEPVAAAVPDAVAAINDVLVELAARRRRRMEG